MAGTQNPQNNDVQSRAGEVVAESWTGISTCPMGKIVLAGQVQSDSIA